MHSELERLSQSRSVREIHRYESIALKEFKSSIPNHLLVNLHDDERFIVESLSKLENQYNWISDAVLKINSAVVDLDARVLILEEAHRNVQSNLVTLKAIEARVDTLWDWKQIFSGKWAVLAVLVIMLVPIVLKVLIDFLMKFIKV